MAGSRYRRGKIHPTRGTRSKFESTIQSKLEDDRVVFGYETEQLEYEENVRVGHCAECGSSKVVQRRKYTPDFIITRKDGTKLYVEAKGYFKSTDRSKMRAVLKSNPGIDIRLVFMTDGKIDDTTRYSDWCMKYGFDFHIGKEVPKQWIK